MPWSLLKNLYLCWKVYLGVHLEWGEEGGVTLRFFFYGVYRKRRAYLQTFKTSRVYRLREEAERGVPQPAETKAD